MFWSSCLVSHPPTPTPTPPGHSMPKGTKQGDDQRRRLLDNHQHRQGRIHLLRGHGPRPLACHPGACGGELTGMWKRPFRFSKFPPLTGHFTCTTSQVYLSCLPAAKRRRGCRHAGADGTELHSKSAGLVRRRWGWDHVQVGLCWDSLGCVFLASLLLFKHVLGCQVKWRGGKETTVARFFLFIPRLLSIMSNLKR